MANLTEKILLEIRDDIREMKTDQREMKEELTKTNQRLDETNQRLGALAHITRSIDTRLERIESREPERLFLPQRVDALEARVTRLESASSDD